MKELTSFGVDSYIGELTVNGLFPASPFGTLNETCPPQVHLCTLGPQLVALCEVEP